MKVKIGLLGFGNVGTGVYKILQQNGSEILHRDSLDISIARVLVRDMKKKRNIPVDPALLTDNVDDIMNDPSIDIVAEFLGGIEPARSYILRALESGKTVVTANKEVMARYWHELEKTARKKSVGIYYEASVAGGIPVIKAMTESLQANRVNRIMGIINGTTNYILNRMSEDGKSYTDALLEAQKLGIAEPDPTADVEGFDAMYKLSILSSIAFHTRVHIENIHREGISRIAVEDIQFGRELGYVLKLLAIAKRKGNTIEARVHPTFVPAHHPLASVRDSFNAIFVSGDAVGDLMFYGRGAGDMPTGSAVVSDIVTACRNTGRHPYATFYNEETVSPEIQFADNWETEYFVRLTVKDSPGVLARIAGIFGKYEVSIASVIQRGHNGEAVPLIFITHKAKEHSINRAIEDIAREEAVYKVENVIRVER